MFTKPFPIDYKRVVGAVTAIKESSSSGLFGKVVSLKGRAGMVGISVTFIMFNQKWLYET